MRIDTILLRIIEKTIKNKEHSKAADYQLDAYKTKASYFYPTNYF